MQLQLLWELQELDLSIKNLQVKIEAAFGLSGVNEAKVALEELEDDYSKKENQFKADRKKLKQMELEEQAIADQSKELKENMYGGKVTNVKELEQMHRRLDHLADNKKLLEENIIDLMESIETLEEELANVADKIKQAQDELNEKERELEKKKLQYNQELGQLQAQREELVKKIEKKYLDKYLTLVQKHHGKALARVNDDICSGCRVFISSALKGHLYNPSAMVYCENCGRLLVKLE